MRLGYERPGFYKGSISGLIGHEAVAPWPAYTQWMDYELELGFVVGRRGRNLTPEEAQSHLFGVTIFNDFSARDIQFSEMRLQLGPAKGKDFATAVGPWITTVDELDLADLDMRARVNGEEWSHGNSGSKWWSPGELLAYISWGETLQPGDLVGSGTVGLGCGLELGRRLEPGDMVELEVERDRRASKPAGPARGRGLGAPGPASRRLNHSTREAGDGLTFLSVLREMESERVASPGRSGCNTLTAALAACLTSVTNGWRVVESSGGRTSTRSSTSKPFDRSSRIQSP